MVRSHLFGWFCQVFFFPLPLLLCFKRRNIQQAISWHHFDGHRHSITGNGTETAKASGASKPDTAAVRRQKVGERNREKVLVCSVTHLKFNLHSTPCQNSKAKMVWPQHRCYQNGQIYGFHDCQKPPLERSQSFSLFLSA